MDLQDMSYICKLITLDGAVHWKTHGSATPPGKVYMPLQDDLGYRIYVHQPMLTHTVNNGGWGQHTVWVYHEDPDQYI